MSRGATHWVKGPDANADLIGLKPELSCIKTEDEGLYIGQHEFWLQTMKKAFKAEQAERRQVMLSYEAIQAFLYQEARAQAEKRWADWLACYADDVDYLHAVLGRRRQAHHRPAERGLADLLPEQAGPRGSGVPHRDRPLERIDARHPLQPLDLERRDPRAGRDAGGSVLQLDDAQLPLRHRRHLLRYRRATCSTPAAPSR